MPFDTPRSARPANYQAYLQTPHWDNQRRRALAYARYRCQLCNAGRVELHVHHRTYDRLGDEWPSDLVVLCADCHARFHDRVALHEGLQHIAGVVPDALARILRAAGRP